MRAPPAAAEAARLRSTPSMALTPKEREVLELLARNLSNKEIGLAMQVGEETIKWHMKNLFAKLDAGTRKQVVQRARILGLLDTRIAAVAGPPPSAMGGPAAHRAPKVLVHRRRPVARLARQETPRHEHHPDRSPRRRSRRLAGRFDQGRAADLRHRRRAGQRRTSASPRATPALVAEIRALLLKHHVLFFRDQDITRAEHVAFARHFGELEDHPVAGSDPENPGLVRIYKSPDQPNDRYENAWHTDATWREKPPFGCVLRCVECPPVGGDTMWANMALAYERLPEHVKTQIAGLRARHSIEASFGAAMPIEKRLALKAQFPDAEHPVVRTHPETGEKVLFVNAFTTHFTNFHTAENVRFGQDYAPGASAAAAVPDQPGLHPRVPGALALEAEQHGDVGQPLAPSTTR